MALGTFFTGVDSNGDPVAAPPPPSAPAPMTIMDTLTEIQNDPNLIIIIVIAVLFAILAILCACFLGYVYAQEKKGKPVFKPMSTTSASKPKMDISSTEMGKV